VTAYIGVGSNIRPEYHIRETLKHLAGRGFRITGISTHYRTEPAGERDAPLYINGVWKIESDCPGPEDLNRRLKDTEAFFGRERGTDPHAPRPIDLDILLFENREVLHRDIFTRNFVYLPLLELEPDLVLPDGTLLRQRVDREDMSGISPLNEYTNKLRRTIYGQG